MGEFATLLKSYGVSPFRNVWPVEVFAKVGKTNSCTSRGARSSFLEKNRVALVDFMEVMWGSLRTEGFTLDKTRWHDR